MYFRMYDIIILCRLYIIIMYILHVYQIDIQYASVYYIFFVLQFLRVYTIKYCHPSRYECTSTANDGCRIAKTIFCRRAVANFAHYRMTVLYVYVHLPNPNAYTYYSKAIVVYAIVFANIFYYYYFTRFGAAKTLIFS